MPRTKRYQPIPDNVCEDRRLDEVSEGSQNLWFRFLSKCDDDGRFHGDPLLLKAYLYPLSDLPVETIKARVGQLIDAGLLESYRADGEMFLRVRNYLTSATQRKKIRYPGRPEDHEAVHPNPARAVREETLFTPAAARAEADVFFSPDPAAGTNGNRSIPGGTKWGPVPVPEHPLPDTPTPTPTRPVTGDARGVAVGHGTDRRGTDLSVGSETGTDGNGAARLASSERAMQQAAFFATSDALKAAEFFAGGITSALKPGTAESSDRQDAIALAFHLRAKNSSPAGWMTDLRAAWAMACQKTATGGGYGAWRVAMVEKYGRWSVATPARGRRSAPT